MSENLTLIMQLNHIIQQTTLLPNKTLTVIFLNIIKKQGVVLSYSLPSGTRFVGRNNRYWKNWINRCRWCGLYHPLTVAHWQWPLFFFFACSSHLRIKDWLCILTIMSANFLGQDLHSIPLHWLKDLDF